MIVRISLALLGLHALLALASLTTACREPAVVPATAEKPVAEASADAQDDDGERRARAVADALVGRPGPALAVTALDGRPIDLAALRGVKPVYLKFWATWCVPCREQMPGFAKIHAELGDRIEVLAVATGFADDEAAVRAFRDEHGLTMPIVIDDGRLAAAVDLRVTPQHVVIGRDGRIVHVGHRDDRRLHDALAAAIAGDASPPEVAGGPAAVEPRFAPGDRVGGLSLTTLDGRTHPLGAAPDGRPTALMFFAPWCESYLADSRPQTSQACRRVREEVEVLAADGGVRWFAVAGGLWATGDDLEDYARTTTTRLPLALDAHGEILRAFSVRQIPAVALLDADGRLARVLGPDDRGLADALAAVRAAAAADVREDMPEGAPRPSR